MQRLAISVMVLAGITLSGALGGHVLRQGSGSSRLRLEAPRLQHRVVAKVVSAACPVVSGHVDATCDAQGVD